MSRGISVGPRLVVGDPAECWIWQGSINPKTRYGTFRTGSRKNGHTFNAHRLVYQLMVGTIPAGGQIDHLCRNRACVNPAHMEIVTNRENALRRPDVIAARSREMCPKCGTDLTPENIYVRPNGTVECRECKRESVRSWRAKQ